VYTQATALRLQQEKLHREKAIEEATWRFEHGEAPTEDAVKELSRQDRKKVRYVRCTAVFILLRSD
jgi:uncharacterized membrane protein YjjP (DUF1212 family)